MLPFFSEGKIWSLIVPELGGKFFHPQCCSAHSHILVLPLIGLHVRSGTVSLINLNNYRTSVSPSSTHTEAEAKGHYAQIR